MISKARVRKSVDAHGSHVYVKFIDGQDRLLGSVNGTSLHAARARAATIENDLWQESERGVESIPEELTAEKLFKDYSAFLRATRSRTRKNSAIKSVREFIEFCPDGKKPISDMPVAEVTAEMLDAWFASIEEKSELARSTWHIGHDVKACWNWAAGNSKGEGGRHLPRDYRPFADVFIEKASKAKTQRDLIPDESIEEIMWHARRFHHLEQLMQIAYLTGSTHYELCAADVGHFFSKGKVIQLGEDRHIKLCWRSENIIRGICQHRKSELPMFSTSLGKRWSPLKVAKRFREIRNRVKLPRLTFASFQDTRIAKRLLSGDTALQIGVDLDISVNTIRSRFKNFTVK